MGRFVGEKVTNVKKKPRPGLFLGPKQSLGTERTNIKNAFGPNKKATWRSVPFSLRQPSRGGRAPPALAVKFADSILLLRFQCACSINCAGLDMMSGTRVAP
jgi:hypothetical protein